jgi:uncharacterized membrane protein YfcA
MEPTTIVAILLGGLLAGFLTGVLGVGGGVVMVPTLYQIFLAEGWKTRPAFTTAVATSLMAMMFTSAYAAYVHRRNGLLKPDLVLWTALGTIVGSLIGVTAMIATDDRITRLAFGLFLWLVAMMMYLPKAKERATDYVPTAKYKGGLLLTGCFMGTVSSLFGIGGATLIVPALIVFFGIAIHQAIATATALIVATAFFGSITYFVMGFNDPQTMIHGAGWVHPWAVLLMVPGAMLTSRLGIRLAMKFSRNLLRNLMVIFQVSVGARFIFW